MHEAAAVFVLFVLYLLPWESPYLIGAYFVMAIAALLYLCMALVHRFMLSKHLGHRMGEPTNTIERAEPLPYDDAGYDDETNDGNRY